MEARALALMHFGRAWFPRQRHPSYPVRHTTAFRPPHGEGEFAALKQACSTEYHGAQGAFKDSMIHGILQFTLPIAFRCVLHRWENQEIRCRKLCIVRRTIPTMFTYIQNHTSFLWSMTWTPSQCTGVGVDIVVGARDARWRVRMASPKLH